MNPEALAQTLPESAWAKSSYSGGEGGECVEIATCARAIHIRDSKAKSGPIPAVDPDGWAAFVDFAAGD